MRSSVESRRSPALNSGPVLNRLQPPDVQPGLFQRAAIERRFDVRDAAAGYHLRDVILQRMSRQRFMHHAQCERIGTRQFIPGQQANTVFALRFVCVGERIVNEYFAPEPLQFRHHVGHFGVAQVGTVFLEREAEHVDRAPLHRAAGARSSA